MGPPVGAMTRRRIAGHCVSGEGVPVPMFLLMLMEMFMIMPVHLHVHVHVHVLVHVHIMFKCRAMIFRIRNLIPVEAHSFCSALSLLLLAQTQPFRTAAPPSALLDTLAQCQAGPNRFGVRCVSRAIPLIACNHLSRTYIAQLIKAFLNQLHSFLASPYSDSSPV